MVNSKERYEQLALEFLDKVEGYGNAADMALIGTAQVYATLATVAPAFQKPEPAKKVKEAKDQNAAK